MKDVSAIRVGIFLAILYPSVAWGQAWLADRSNDEGPGIKIGDSMVLHLGIGAEGGFDSNSTYRNDPVPAGRLRITPYVDLATRSTQRMQRTDSSVRLTPPKILFRLGFATWYDRYFSNNDAVDRFNSGFNPFGFDTRVDLTVLPERKVSLVTGISYLKTMDPYESNASSQDRHQLEPTVALRIKPGGGALEIETRYRFGLLYFTDTDIGDRSNRMTHDASLETRWKFLPQTALVSSVLFTPHIYYGSDNINENSKPVRTYLGLQSLLLNKLGVKLLVGYGASFYDNGPDFDSVLVDGAVMFYVSPFARITLGGQRDFVDSFYANYYVQNGGYVSYDHMFAGRLLLALKFSAFHRSFADFDGSVNDAVAGTASDPNTNNRSDVMLLSSLRLEYRASDWLAFHVTGRFLADITDFEVTHTWTDTNGSGQTSVLPSDYVKFETLAGVRFQY